MFSYASTFIGLDASLLTNTSFRKLDSGINQHTNEKARFCNLHAVFRKFTRARVMTNFQGIFPFP